MGSIGGRRLGFTGLTLSLLFVLYYTLWIIGLPFVQPEYQQLVSSFFPPISIGLGVPAAIGTTAFLFLFLEAYYLVCKDRALDKLK